MQPMQGFSTPVHAPVTVATPASGEAEAVDLAAEPGPDGHGNMPVASSDQDAAVAAAELSALLQQFRHMATCQLLAQIKNAKPESCSPKYSTISFL
jgi:hypothetical protein